jgi:hypothetical protein
VDLLHDLEKWQAASKSELVNFTPAKLFEQKFAKRYQLLHSKLWRRICRAHGTLYTLEQLEAFPYFEYLYPPNRMEFWKLVVYNFFDTMILMLSGLVSDAGGDAHTLLSFKNDIAQGPWLDQSKRDLFKRTLRSAKFDAGVQSLTKRVRKVRDHHIAHELIDKQSGNVKEVLAGIKVRELRRLFDAAHSLFAALSFGTAYITLVGDLTPTTVGGMPTPTCLDQVLDAVLRDSYFGRRQIDDQASVRRIDKPDAITWSPPLATESPLKLRRTSRRVCRREPMPGDP